MSKNGEVKPDRRIIFYKSGSNAISCRVSIPKTWIDEMEIEKDTPVKISFIDKKIIIEKQ